jgi:type II secretory pathway predicted ATPase ExeA
MTLVVEVASVGAMEMEEEETA